MSAPCATPGRSTSRPTSGPLPAIRPVRITCRDGLGNLTTTTQFGELDADGRDLDPSDTRSAETDFLPEPGPSDPYLADLARETRLRAGLPGVGPVVRQTKLFYDAVLQIRWQDPAVVDSMPQPFTRELGLRTLHGVQRLLNSAVAHGVHGALPASPVRPPEQVVEVFLLPVGDAVA